VDPDRPRAGPGRRPGDAVLADLTGANEANDGILGGEAAARFRTYDATATYVRERAAGRPLVLVLDDLHWADLSSLRLLLFLARQLHDASALVIGTYRDAEVTSGEHPARPLLAELAGQAGLLPLTGLTASEAGQLLTRVCGEQPPAALTAAVHERTGGNPFFVQQIARLLAARGAPLVDAPVTGVPPAVGDVLARRLARLPRDVVDLLAIVVAACDLIPMIGATLGAVIGVLVTVLATELWPTTVIVTGFFLLYQQLENYLIAPRIQRSTVSLSAAAVLVAALIGGTALGLVGAVMAIPVAAVLKVVLTERLQARDADASGDSGTGALAEPVDPPAPELESANDAAAVSRPRGPKGAQRSHRGPHG